MTDLNTAIAAFKGYYTAPIYVGDIAWFSPEGQLLNPTPPDFEHDANLYMALYFELPITERINLGFRNKDDFGHEVCLSFCKLKGIEVVG